jgi:hypothetical protein
MSAGAVARRSDRRGERRKDGAVDLLLPLSGSGVIVVWCEQLVSIGVSLSSFLTTYTQFELPQNEANAGNHRQFRAC